MIFEDITNDFECFSLLHLCPLDKLPTNAYKCKIIGNALVTLHCGINSEEEMQILKKKSVSTSF